MSIRTLLCSQQDLIAAREKKDEELAAKKEQEEAERQERAALRLAADEKYLNTLKEVRLRIASGERWCAQTENWALLSSSLERGRAWASACCCLVCSELVAEVAESLRERVPRAARAAAAASR